MFAAIIPIATLLAQYAPQLVGVARLAGIAGSPQIVTAVTTAIDVVEKLVPLAIQGAKEALPTLRNVIATLRGVAGTPAEQLDRLDAIEATIDANWDEALAKAQAEDAAAAKGLTADHIDRGAERERRG